MANDRERERQSEFTNSFSPQVGDLQYASPATVSRCGMVFVDPKNLSYEPFWLRWVANFDESDRKELQALYEKFVPPCISLILEGMQDGRQGEKLKTILPVTNLNLVSLLIISVSPPPHMYMYDCY